MLYAQSLYYPEMVDLSNLSKMQIAGSTIIASLHDETMMVVLIATSRGYSVPTHTHPHEQIGMVLSGKAALRIGNNETIVKQGDFYSIPADVPHTDTCIGDEPFVEMVFYPAGEDEHWYSEEKEVCN
jgi:quercetin dioxygenase-like cupin family protein